MVWIKIKEGTKHHYINNHLYQPESKRLVRPLAIVDEIWDRKSNKIWSSFSSSFADWVLPKLHYLMLMQLNQNKVNRCKLKVSISDYLLIYKLEYVGQNLMVLKQNDLWAENYGEEENYLNKCISVIILTSSTGLYFQQQKLLAWLQ